MCHAIVQSVHCLWQAYFMDLVEGRVAASTSYVRAFVHQYIAGRIGEARRSIESYASQYSKTMEDALEVHRRGADLVVLS